MRNRFTRACYALAAGVAVSTGLAISAAGVANASTQAPAATPSCNGASCVNTYTAEWGPGYILKARYSAAVWGNRVILKGASDFSPGEDWTIYFQGTVKTFAALGLVSPNLTLHYSSDPAFELQFSPYGVNSGLCEGTAVAAFSDEPITLNWCGTPGGLTAWIVDLHFHTGPYTGFTPFIAGSDTNYSDPYVASAKALNRLVTFRLQSFSDGIVYSNELWSDFPGVVGPAI
jgi:hypothetical protein